MAKYLWLLLAAAALSSLVVPGAQARKGKKRTLAMEEEQPWERMVAEEEGGPARFRAKNEGDV